MVAEPATEIGAKHRAHAINRNELSSLCRAHASLGRQVQREERQDHRAAAVDERPEGEEPQIAGNSGKRFFAELRYRVHT